MKYRMGLLVAYKGYEHIDDGVPEMAELGIATPDAFDWREEYPRCLPTTVVRNQANCGSCWAFAAASAIMHALCIDAEGKSDQSIANEQTLEVSVQKIMSCNDNAYGCQGGAATVADREFQKNGMTKESDAPYMCGQGSALNHFADGASCAAAPWGGVCEPVSTNPDWTYGTMESASGETKMKEAVVAGKGVFVGFW